jgi:hypothetical protein
MNKIKIYFSKAKVCICAPWVIAFKRGEDPTIHHLDDIEIDLGCHKTKKLKTDYMSSWTADEMRVLITMLEYAVSICENKVTFEQVKLHPGMARSCFPDAEIFIVEE